MVRIFAALQVRLLCNVLYLHCLHAASVPLRPSSVPVLTTTVPPAAGLQQVPKCFHGEAAEQKRVNKTGPNQGKRWFELLMRDGCWDGC